MFKKVVGMVLVCIMMFNCFISFSPVLNVYAFNNFEVEVIKDNAPLRDGYYESKDVIKRYSKGTVITVVDEKKNLWGNLWYKIKGGGYIFSGNVKKVTKPHKCSYKLKLYEDAHPHYANYECSCGSGYCSTETKKKDGCSKCYPHQHSYKLTHYEDAHPHYANYKCSCGSGYCGTETRKIKSCEECFPKAEEVHKCSFDFIGYDDMHPHAEMYECSCGKGYSGAKTKKVKGCTICYPDEDEEEQNYGHVCYYEDLGMRRWGHPHYVVEECRICGNQRENRKQTEVFYNCFECANNINFKNFNSPFNFGLYDVNQGQYVYFKVSGVAEEDYDVSNGLHTMLDICGFAPVVGMVCDGVNVLYYLVEKDYLNAGLSSISFLPYVGIVSTGGKLYAKTGTVIVDTMADSADNIIRGMSKVVIKNQDLISETAESIIKNYSKYSDDVLETVGKISRNESVSLGSVYHNNKLLISETYSGTIKTPSGLKLSGLTKEGHRMHHITMRHGANLKGTSGHGTLFNVDGEELFKLIDEVYGEGKIAKKPVLQSNGNTKVVYQASKEVGLNGEKKIEFILRGDELITAYPVK